MSKQEEALLKAGFDHPCKQTCSGWKQGYERGQSELAELRKDKARLDFLIENRFLVTKRAMWFTRTLEGFTGIIGQRSPREAIDAAMKERK